MEPIKVFREPWEADARLTELKLTREGLLKVRDIAMQEAANATAFHPANAAGTFAYHHGTWALRDVFVGADWEEDRVDGIEAIRNEALKVKIAFCNVDVACDKGTPKPRSKKGAGAQRASGQGDLFGGSLQEFSPGQTGEYALYYVMVDEKGAAELTRPVLRGGTFITSIERIFLSRGDDGDSVVVPTTDTGPTDQFDPQVVRK